MAIWPDFNSGLSLNMTAAISVIFTPEKQYANEVPTSAGSRLAMKNQYMNGHAQAFLSIT